MRRLARVDGGSRSPEAELVPCSELPSSPLLSLSPSLPFVFLLLQTSSSAVALSSLGLHGSAPSPHQMFPPPPPAGPSVFLPPIKKPSPAGPGHTLEALGTEDSDSTRGLLPPVAPSWLDSAGLGVTPDIPNSSFSPSEGSLGPLAAKSQACVLGDPNLVVELSRAPPSHTLLSAGCAGPQEAGDPRVPSANPLCPEEAVAASWEQPRALGTLRPETPLGALPSFQEVAEPAIVATDRQAIFPDTWSLTKERGRQKERAGPEPGEPESGCPALVDKEQLGGETPTVGSPIRPTQGPETPRRPEGTAEAAAKAGREQPELPQAVVVDTPSTTERISTSGQAGVSSCGCLAWPRPSSRQPSLADCMWPPPLRMSAWAAHPQMLWPETRATSTGQQAPWGQRGSLGPGVSLSDTPPLALWRLFPLDELPLTS